MGEPEPAPGAMPEATVDVVSGGDAGRSVEINSSPFNIGRGNDEWNHLALQDARISRKSAAIVFEENEFHLEDLGQRHGLYVNGTLVQTPVSLKGGDVITFGNTDAVSLVFHSGPERESLTELLSRMDAPGSSSGVDLDLRHLNLLLEATALLQAHMPFEEVLAAMVDRAITITQAERGVLLQSDSEEQLVPIVARSRGGFGLPPASVKPSQTAIQRGLADRSGYVQEDLSLAADSMKAAESIVSQRLRSLVVLPLYSFSRAEGEGGSLLGVLYLDSKRPAAFSGLERQILDALATEAASVIDNARMVERERERQQMEQDLSIARGIQQRLLPKKFKQLRYLEVSGINQSCYQVGGDYFDLVELDKTRAVFVIADVAGKGLAASLLTALLQGGFAGIALTPEPTKLIDRFNRYVWARSEPNLYATAFIGVLGEDGGLECINAGHYSALLVHDGEVTAPFPSDSFPIGLFPDAEFRSRSAALERGDTLVMVTDGISEAADRSGEEFGMERLSEVVRANHERPIEEMQTSILRAVEQFAAGTEQADDMTLLIVRYTGLQPA